MVRLLSSVVLEARPLLGGESAAAFLGTQGDVWDTQWDMFLCFIGAMTAQLLFARRHDAELRILNGVGV